LRSASKADSSRPRRRCLTSARFPSRVAEGSVGLCAPRDHQKKSRICWLLGHFTAALSALTRGAFERALSGIPIRGIVGNTERTLLDECAHVYEQLDEALAVLEAENIARVAHRLFPVANLKARTDILDWSCLHPDIAVMGGVLSPRD
jgi:hypothetical protein